MYPRKEVAIQIIEAGRLSNPNLWVIHSYEVAKCAEKIAIHLGLDSEKAYVLGLLHDIGKSTGNYHFRHISQGYYDMMKLNFDEVARICLTHSFPTHSIDTYIGNFDVDNEVVKDIESKLLRIEFDIYDELIQLCDCLAGATVVDMKERMEDCKRRYGSYPLENQLAYFDLKNKFEKRCSCNVYELVTDNSKLWGK